MNLIGNKTVVEMVVSELLENMNMNIRLVQLGKRMSEYLNKVMGKETEQKLMPVVFKHERQNAIGMKEQRNEQVIALRKDNLMPKQLNRQTHEDMDTINLSHSFMLKSPKRHNIGTRSSRKKKSGSVSMNVSKTSSFSVSERMKKKEKQSLFISLQVNDKEEDDDEMNGCKIRKDAQIREQQKQRRLQEMKLKVLREKRQQFQQEFKAKQYTYDFDGNALNYMPTDGNLNYYSMKMRMSGEDQIERTEDKSVLKGSTNNPTFIKNKKLPKKAQDIERFDATLHIPMFGINQNRTTNIFGIPTEVKNYRLKDYRKHYGGKFNRLEKSLNTINFPERQKTPKQLEGLFSSRRHFKDESSELNRSLATQKSHEYHRRKLALPKLKGKYSTLDRYEQD